MKGFDISRDGYGTREWSEISFNVGVGCSHNCRYCFARYNAVSRFKTVRNVSDWERERIKYGIRSVKIGKVSGVVMMPTTHDITEFYLSEFIIAARRQLEIGNKVLIVSKPHLSCIAQICANLGNWKRQILFRFTIGTMDNDTARFWEPGAPEIAERLDCLKFAFKSGYATSVSCEPLLGGHSTAVALVDTIESLVTDTIWIGPMNKIRQRVDCSNKDVLLRVQEIEHMQRPSEMLRLYDDLQENSKVRWKGSILKIVERLEGE